jgi:Fe2+-dicitrate sensor, membrane component
MSDDSDIRDLLQRAGKREQPDADMMNELRQTTYAAWQQAVKQNRQAKRRRWLTGVALAASVFAVTALVGFQLTRGFGEPSVRVAAVAYQQGAINIISKSREANRLTALFSRSEPHSNGENVSNRSVANQPLYSNDIISTAADGLVRLELADSTVLILAADTALQLQSASRVKLIKGKLYLDSPGTKASTDITTAWGNIRDIGTQYELSVDESRLQVAVREGQVEISLRDQKPVYAGVVNNLGDVIVIDRSNKITTTKVAANDDYWMWAQSASAGLNLEGLSVYDLLTWAGRVTGKSVTYESTQIKYNAQHTHFSGGVISAEDIELNLIELLKTTRLSASLNSDSILLRSSE